MSGKSNNKKAAVGIMKPLMCGEVQKLKNKNGQSCVMLIWLQRFRSSCAGVTEGSTALRSRTAEPCAERGSPPSGQERGSETTAASGSWRQEEPFSRLGLSELEERKHD